MSIGQREADLRRYEDKREREILLDKIEAIETHVKSATEKLHDLEGQVDFDLFHQLDAALSEAARLVTKMQNDE